jgi:hypothetical protein
MALKGRLAREVPQDPKDLREPLALMALKDRLAREVPQDPKDLREPLVQEPKEPLALMALKVIKG